MILVIDNYDSFTYNLVQYFGELGAELRVVRNDEVTVDEIVKMKPAKLVVSPGPCTPTEAGISCEAIARLGPTIPTLGVCLGHQSIGQVYGGKVVRAGRLMHGKTSLIRHNGKGVFNGYSESLRGDPLPLPARRARVAACRTGNHGGHGRGRNHGAPAQEPSGVRRSVSPGIHSHAERQADPEELPGPVDPTLYRACHPDADDVFSSRIWTITGTSIRSPIPSRRRRATFLATN